MSLKLIIVEDEINAMEVLQRKIEKLGDNCQIIGTADSVASAKNILGALDCDLLLLDIDLRDGTGFNLLEQLDEINFEVIFTTAYNEYALDAFKVNAVDYLLKPIDDNDLVKACSRAAERIELKNNDMFGKLSELLNSQENSNKLALKERGKITFIDKNEILYLKADGVYTVIVTKDGKHVSSLNLGHYEKVLKAPYLLRVHRSSIINTNEVKEYYTSEHSVKMSDGSIIPVSGDAFKKSLL